MNMKTKIFLICALAAMIAVGCENTNNNTNNGTETPGGGGGGDITNPDGGLTQISGTIVDIDELQPGTYTLRLFADSKGEQRAELAHTTVAANGTFTLSLPATVDERYLYEIAAEMPQGITVSDPDVLSTGAYFQLSTSEGEMCHVYIDSENEVGGAFAEGALVFINAALDITGTYEEVDYYDNGNEVDRYNVTFDIHGKKGWNRVYSIYDSNGNETMTTTLPAGFRMVYCLDFGSEHDIPEPKEEPDNHPAGRALTLRVRR